MTVWALSDLHLAWSTPAKNMAVFGTRWHDYMDKIKKNWEACIKPDDLVLLPGDISWALKFQTALQDLVWIHALPGTKVMIKGNHDYWWDSLNKMRPSLPSSIQLIQNNALLWNNIAIGGSRLWDTEEYSFKDYIDYVPRTESLICKQPLSLEEQEKIFSRELHRLELSLQALDPKATTRIALTHYPPIGADLAPSRASALLERYKIDICIFGHLHNVRDQTLPFGEKNGVRYLFASADYLDFQPLKVL